MPIANGLVNSLITGLLLYFALAWFRVSRHFTGNVDLADAINAIFEYPAVVIFKNISDILLASIFIYAAWYSFAVGWFVIYPSSLPEWAADMGMIAYGYAGIFHLIAIFFDLAVDVLRAFPVEIAVVFATLAFLHIVTSGSKYGTN